MVQVGLCTVLMTLKTDMCRANFYVNVEKLLCFIDYWIVYKLVELLLRGSYYIHFNLKAGNALATSSVFLPEVFKPQIDELFVSL